MIVGKRSAGSTFFFELSGFRRELRSIPSRLSSVLICTPGRTLFSIHARGLCADGRTWYYIHACGVGADGRTWCYIMRAEWVPTGALGVIFMRAEWVQMGALGVIFMHVEWVHICSLVAVSKQVYRLKLNKGLEYRMPSSAL